MFGKEKIVYGRVCIGGNTYMVPQEVSDYVVLLEGQIDAMKWVQTPTPFAEVQEAVRKLQWQKNVVEPAICRKLGEVQNRIHEFHETNDKRPEIVITKSKDGVRFVIPKGCISQDAMEVIMKFLSNDKG